MDVASFAVPPSKFSGYKQKCVSHIPVACGSVLDYGKDRGAEQFLQHMSCALHRSPIHISMLGTLQSRT